jgi:hypothetical protein
VEELGVDGDFNLQASFGNPSLNLSSYAELDFFTRDSIELIDDLWMSGKGKCLLKGHSMGESQAFVRFSGGIEVDSLGAHQGKLFALHGLRGHIPFQIDMDTTLTRFIPQVHSYRVNESDYEEKRELYRSLFKEIGDLQIRSVQIYDYQIEHLRADMEIAGGYIHIPMFRLYLLDGNLGGSLMLDLKDGSPQNIVYDIKAQISRINSAALIEDQKKKGEKTELNATLAFQGRGISLEEGIDLNGYFHITQMGARFASTLLKGMDPEGSDRSIRMTRRLLDMGWKPKLFSFELRHGYVYPSLTLAQPWFSPIRLPERLEYGRLPLAFFLESLPENQ